MLLTDLTWPAIKALSKDTPVLIPVAAVEQHGHHMPLATDSLLLAEVVRRVEQALSSQILVAPLMWLGNSDHHLDFPGTVSAAPRVYLDMLVGLFDNFVTHGFKRLYMLNGHGGNDVPGKQAVFEVRQKYRHREDLLLLFSTYWSVGTRHFDSPEPLVQREMGHACEWETSMMLRIAPHLVGNFQAAEVVPPGNPFLPATRGWVTKQRSQPGHIGQPQQASAEKGEALLAGFSQDVQQMLERIIAWDGISWEG